MTPGKVDGTLFRGNQMMLLDDMDEAEFQKTMRDAAWRLFQDHGYRREVVTAGNLSDGISPAGRERFKHVIEREATAWSKPQTNWTSESPR